MFDSCEALFMSVSYDLFKKSANFQLSTPISHRILGGKQHKCSKDNLGHSLHYQLENSSHLWLWNHTSETCPGVLFSQTWHPLSLLRKTAETEAAPSSFLNHWTSQPRKTQRHGLKKMVQFFVLGNAAIDTANFRNASGPCMDFCVHVLDSYLCNLKVVFN